MRRPKGCVRLPHGAVAAERRSGGQQSAKTVATRTLGRSTTSLATARREGSPARADESWTIAPGSAPEFCLPAPGPLRVKAPEGCPSNAVDAAQGNAIDVFSGHQRLEQL